MKILRLSFFVFTWFLLISYDSYAEDSRGEPRSVFSQEEMRFLEESEPTSLSDPLEPLNRVIFVFNDRLYFWALKPVSSLYAFIFPEPLRVCFSRAIDNLKMPVRAVNCLLQLKPIGFLNEVGRFLINTTLGILGLADPAKDIFGLLPQDEDLGQTFGYYGAGPGFYIVWPILGPSNLRDSIGKAGDAFLNPFSYLDTREMIYTRSFEVTNEVSLRGITYENLKASSIDPYISLRDAYHQNREAKVRK